MILEKKSKAVVQLIVSYQRYCLSFDKCIMAT